MARIRKSEAMAFKKSQFWSIAAYIRLSREDGLDESKSITEQKKIITEFLEQFFIGEYVVVDYYIDDGLTGTDDTRDNFQRMMDDVDSRRVNCIVCKTLSRAFRNYADQGRYLEQIFPLKGVRFISISNPHVDSFTNPDAIQNGMEIPINGLMNDRFAAKTSADIRRTFETKRRRGEFIGGFAPYGYQKKPDNKNSLIIDNEAASVVRDIFAWYVIDGMSKTGIAKKLNSLGIPNPSQYKSKTQQLNYQNPYSQENDGRWNGTVISRMLKNEMYIGNMVQGRHKMISYKVHTQVSVPKEDWVVVENTHEAIVDKELFEKAQSLHIRDTRTAPGKIKNYLFSGLLTCADCKKAMRRKTSKNYVYYYCRTETDKGKGSCSKHVIREDALSKAVLDAIRIQIALIGSLSDILDGINKTPTVKTHSTRLNSSLKMREQELQKVLTASDGLYLDWKSGEITKDDYRRMKDRFDEQISKLKEAIAGICNEMETMAVGIKTDDPYLTKFMKHKDIDTLERGILVELIDTVFVHSDGSITIDFNFADELKRVADYIENNRNDLTLVVAKSIS